MIKSKWTAKYRPELGGNHPHNAYVEIDVTPGPDFRDRHRQYKFSGMNHPDAQLLTKMINAHELLIEACRAMQNVLRSGPTDGKDLTYECELARKALEGFPK